MADYPALPLWTDAYLADTTHLPQLPSPGSNGLALAVLFVQVAQR